LPVQDTLAGPVVILALDGLIARTVLAFKDVSAAVSLSLVRCLGGVTFSLFLNGARFLLNRGPVRPPEARCAVMARYRSRRPCPLERRRRGEMREPCGLPCCV